MSILSELCLPFALVFTNENRITWLFFQSFELAEHFALKHGFKNWSIVRRTDFVMG